MAQPTKLKAGALKLPALLMQGITHIAPAVGLLLTMQVVASWAGIATPLAYTIAFCVVLTLGISLAQLARHLPSAGGYYTYVSRTVHPYAGFLTAWLYFLYDPTGTAINLAFMGYWLDGTVKAEYGLHFPWWAFLLASTALVTFLVYRGIEISTRAMAILVLAEVAIVVGLAVSCLFLPGEGGVNFSSFLPVSAPNARGLYLGVVFSIFAFTGFESVAPLAEETENPRRNLPRGIVGSILLMGAFYLFCSWAVLVGWGTDRLESFVRSSENPSFVVARRLWGGAWILVFLAVLKSILAVSIACTNAATRVFFAMGRAGALPGFLAQVHPRYQTPANAIWLQAVLTLAIGLGLGFWIGPDQEFYFMAVVITLGMALVYSAGNAGVIRLYTSERRSEFRWLPHCVFPLVSTAALIWVGYRSVFPLPPPPIGYAPWLVAVWLALGMILVWVFRRAGREDWVLRAGQAAYEQSAEVEIPRASEMKGA